MYAFSAAGWVMLAKASLSFLICKIGVTISITQCGHNPEDPVIECNTVLRIRPGTEEALNTAPSTLIITDDKRGEPGKRKPEN